MCQPIHHAPRVVRMDYARSRGGRRRAIALPIRQWYGFWRAIFPDGANPSKDGDAKPSAFGLITKAVGLPGTAVSAAFACWCVGKLGSLPATKGES